MKKLLLASLVAIAPAVASAQVQLVSGFNFGQFIGSGAPATDGTTGEPVGFISSNFGPGTQPGDADSGVFHANNAIATPYSAGSSILYFDGSNGSTAFDFAGGTDLSVIERGSPVPVNSQTVNSLIQMALPGDVNNAGLRVTGGLLGKSFSIVTDTAAWADFAPADFTQSNDFNFTFAAYALTGGSGTVQFSLNGVSLGGPINVLGGEYQAFNLDLPANFYGQSTATLVATVTGDLAFDHIQINGLTAIPEPSTYAAILGAAGLVGAMILHRKRA